jgi:CubicO group peptidase (beta-lactamase class C family)
MIAHSAGNGSGDLPSGGSAEEYLRQIQRIADDRTGFSAAVGLLSPSITAVVTQSVLYAGPPAPDCVPVGCVAKLFTTQLVLSAVREGRLALDQSCSDWVSALERLGRTLPEGLRIRHLLDHTHGLPEVASRGMPNSGFINANDLATLLKGFGVSHHPVPCSATATQGRLLPR